MEGWIKLYRKMLDNPIIMKDSDYLAVWVYLLLNATHKKILAVFKGEKIELQPGQLITGRISISEKLKISESKVKRILQELESDQQISRQRSNRNSLISIVNWNTYQNIDQQNDQQMTSKRPASDQQVTTNKNDNNIFNYFINKYKGSQNFGDYIKRNHEMREDPNWNLLTSEQQMKLTGQL